MLTVRKQFAAFLLLFILAIPLFFSTLVLVKQQIAHYERNEKFNKEVLHTIYVSASNIIWVEAGKEILFQGKLFDVKSFVIDGNKITLTGFFDQKEDKMVQQIAQLAMQKNESGNPFNVPAIKFLFFPTCNINVYQTNCDEITWRFVTRQFYRFDEMIPKAPCRLPLHPPC